MTKIETAKMAFETWKLTDAKYSVMLEVIDNYRIKAFRHKESL